MGGWTQADSAQFIPTPSPSSILWFLYLPTSPPHDPSSPLASLGSVSFHSTHTRLTGSKNDWDMHEWMNKWIIHVRINIINLGSFTSLFNACFLWHTLLMMMMMMLMKSFRTARLVIIQPAEMLGQFLMGHGMDGSFPTAAEETWILLSYPSW